MHLRARFIVFTGMLPLFVFLTCSGALAKTVVDNVRKQHKKKGRVEGEARGGWLVVDYGDVILHLFSPDQRSYYQLEELWNKGKVLLRVQ